MYLIICNSINNCNNTDKKIIRYPDQLAFFLYVGKLAIQVVAWDVAVVSIMADSYLHAAWTGGSDVAKLAAARKIDKYYALPSSYIF